MSDGHGSLSLWVVYRSPRDFPGEYVVREQRAGPGGVEIAQHLAARAPTLEGLRRQIRELPGGHSLVRLARDPQDEPQIVEVWI